MPGTGTAQQRTRFRRSREASVPTESTTTATATSTGRPTPAAVAPRVTPSSSTFLRYSVPWLVEDKSDSEGDVVSGALPGATIHLPFVPIWSGTSTVLVHFKSEGELQMQALCGSMLSLFLPEFFPAWLDWTYTVYESNPNPRG